MKINYLNRKFLEAIKDKQMNEYSYEADTNNYECPGNPFVPKWSGPVNENMIQEPPYNLRGLMVFKINTLLEEFKQQHVDLIEKLTSDGIECVFLNTMGEQNVSFIKL